MTFISNIYNADVYVDCFVVNIIITNVALLSLIYHLFQAKHYNRQLVK